MISSYRRTSPLKRGLFSDEKKKKETFTNSKKNFLDAFEHTSFPTAEAEISPAYVEVGLFLEALIFQILASWQNFKVMPFFL